MEKLTIKKANPNNKIVSGRVNFYNKKGEKVYYEVKEFNSNTNKFELLGKNVTINDIK